MTHLPPSLADFAQRLLLHEAGGGQRTQDLISAAGFNALLARAAKLAVREFPFLTAIGAITTPNCSFDGLRQAAEGRDPAEVADALVAILANFFWLLVLFIGESLGLRKVHEIWPDIPFTLPGSSSEKARP